MYIYRESEREREREKQNEKSLCADIKALRLNSIRSGDEAHGYPMVQFVLDAHPRMA